MQNSDYDTLNFLQPNANSSFVPLNSIRLKVTDRCQWNCWWCHNEGTGERDPNVTKDITFDGDFARQFLRVTAELGIREVHLTGGEPTQHPNIVDIIRFLKEHGYKVKMTSVGNNDRIMQKIYMSGIDGINFSLHAIDTAELHSTQIDRTFQWMKGRHADQFASILGARDAGIEVKLNTVMASGADAPRVKDVIEWANEHKLEVRVLHEVQRLAESVTAVRELLADLGAHEQRRKYILGSSSGTIYYVLPNKGRIGFKILRPQYLDTMCSDCPLYANGTCGEYFYGLRLENHLGRHMIRLCVHRTTDETYIALSEFRNTPQFHEIHNFGDRRRLL